MKLFKNPSFSTLLFSALLGALAVIIYRWLFKPTPPSSSRTEPAYNQEPRYQARRRYPPV
jgi:hypothetical protein